MEKKRAKFLFFALAFVLLFVLVLYANGGKDSQYAFYSADIKANSAGPGVTRKVLAHADKLMVCELAVDKGGSAPPHSHPEEQISYIVSGKFEFTIGDEKMVLGPGDTAYMPGNVPHTAVALEKGVMLDIFTPERKDFLP